MVLSIKFDTRGDVLIWGLWEQQTDAIIDVKIGNDDTNTYKFDPMDNILDCWEEKNKDTHGKHCNEKWKMFLCLFFLFMAC